MKLIFVYNAKGGLHNKLLDYAHKIISPSTYQCSLCALTYTNTGIDKRWKSFIDALDVEIEFLHKEEFADKYNTQFAYPVLLKEDNKLSLLLSSKAEVVRKYSDQGVQPQSEETGPAVQLKEQRNNINFFLTGGLGLKYKMPMAFLFLDLRYNYGLTNSVDEATRYANKELTYKYYYVDDNFFVNNAIVSIGYERLFYKPKKKKNKK